jgi:alpha-glucan phosphorylase-like protein
MLPVRSVYGPDGNEARITVELPGRLLHARAWEVQVGRVRLYLLDSDVEQNEPQDRWLTAQLYGGDRRTRIKQEILVGIGGTRLIRDVLKLDPAVYHMNEGHCAFLTLERMKDFVQAGLTPQEAREAIKASTAFTTHTPVPAGNESFEAESLHHYLADYVVKTGVQWEQFLELGRERADGNKQEFSMTVLALKLSSRANAVAKLHGKVSREMWNKVWQGVNVEEIPIFHITNGVHLQTWCSRGMRRLLSSKLPIQWGRNEDDPEVWAGVSQIPDEELWRVHQEQKRNFIHRIKSKIEADYTRRGESPQLIRDTVDNLSPEVLTIGFARRFASYKRADLFLRDWERIKRILCHPQRPVQIIIAGKAHPADGMGKAIIRKIVNAARSGDLKGRIVFLENYNMGIARLLTRGVDVWLNNPLRPHEASGTSGMKLGPNGGLNFSILDGWWDEAYRPGVGWEINAGTEFKNRDHQDERDNMAMLDVLEEQIVPLYYDRNERGHSPGWLAMMKSAIAEVSCRFNTTRMVREYYQESYAPIARRVQRMEADDYKGIKALTRWKRQISSRFASVYVSKVEIRGVTSDLMEAGSELTVDIEVYPGKLKAGELRAEFVVGLRAGDAFADRPEILEFKPSGEQDDSGLLHFSLSHCIGQSGNYLYAVRVVPFHELLAAPQETGLVCWGN